MNKTVLLRGVDDSVAIMTVVSDLEEAVRKFKEAHPGMYGEYWEVDPSVIPTDRSNRDSWKLSKNGKILID